MAASYPTVYRPPSAPQYDNMDSFFRPARQTQQELYQAALQQLQQAYSTGKDQIERGYEQLDSWLQSNLTNPYEQAQRAQVRELNPELLRLLQSQGASGDLYRTELGYRAELDADRAQEFNRMLDLLQMSQAQSNTARMGDARFARQGALSGLEQAKMTRDFELASQNMAQRLGIDLQTAEANVQNALQKMQIAAQLQAAQIGANATLGAAKVNADAARANAQAQIAAQERMQQAGFKFEEQQTLARMNFENEQWFRNAEWTQKMKVLEMQYDAALAANDFKEAQRIASQMMSIDAGGKVAQLGR